MKADEPYTVQELYKECTSKNVFCAGIVEGVMAVMCMVCGLARDAKTAEDRKMILNMGMCPRGPTSVGEAVQAFENWVPKHPKQWSDSGVVGVMIAINETWPCK